MYKHHLVFQNIYLYYKSTIHYAGRSTGSTGDKLLFIIVLMTKIVNKTSGGCVVTNLIQTKMLKIKTHGFVDDKEKFANILI